MHVTSPVCTSPPNGTQFGIDLSNGGTINVDINVSVQAIAAIANATLSLDGTSLSVATEIATLASAQLSNGAVINPGLEMLTLDLRMQNSTINGPVTVGGPSAPIGTINISGSSVQKLFFSGSGTLKNSTVGDNSILEFVGNPSLISNTSFNGFVGVDSGGSLTIDNGSKINSVLNGAAQNVFVGASASGVLTLQGGSQLNISGANLTLGGIQNSSGITVLNDTSSLTADNEIIGDAGSGQLGQSGGTNTVFAGTGFLGASGQVTLGNQITGNGTYNLAGGTLSAATVLVGSAGTGFFNQGAGTTNTISEELSLGDQSGSSGTYNMFGGTLTITNANGNLAQKSIIVGNGGTGVFNQSGGAVSATNLEGWGRSDCERKLFSDRRHEHFIRILGSRRRALRRVRPGDLHPERCLNYPVSRRQ